MRFKILVIHSFLSFLISGSALAQTVVTTLPEFKWAIGQLAPQLKVQSLLSGHEDPHFLDATPGFVFKAAKAQMLVLNGLQLETGWLPKVLEQSGNSVIQPGGTGYCDASVGVEVLGKIKNFNRSMGDVHPQGNPHYTLSLIRMKQAVNAIAKCLNNLDIDKGQLAKKLGALNQKFDAKYFELSKGKTKKVVYVFHREFQYFAQDFKLEIKGSLEKVPGVLPSATYLVKMATQAKKDKPVLVLASSTSSKRVLNKFKELSEVKYIMLPLHPSPEQDYFEFMESTLGKIFE